MGNYFKKLGPGLITGASDDDPSGILTYLQTGVVLGIKSLWLVLFTLPLMYFIQEICGRIGFVTDKGLAKIIKEYYSKKILYLIAFISVIVITINIGADLAAAGIIFEKFSGINKSLWILVISFFIIAALIFFSYRKLTRVMKWLTLSLFFYVATAFFLKIDWLGVFKNTFIPSFDLLKGNIFLIAAFLGTTISPYLFFWQANEEAENREEEQRENGTEKFVVTKNELKILKKDTFSGMFFSNLVAWFIILGASQMGALYGIKEITNFEQAALVLKPLLGDFAFFIFGLGIIGTAFLAIPVLAGSVGYILAETFNWQEGLNKHFHEAKGFYMTICAATLIGLLINFLGVDPINLLIFSAALYAIITPPLIFLIMKIANNREIMGDDINSFVTNFFGYSVFIISASVVVFYFLDLLTLLN